MTNEELLAKIKAEIERLRSNMDDREPLAPNQKAGYLFALADVLSFLSTIESENPMNQEGLEEEIVKVCDDFVFPLYGLDDEFGRELINKIARHFAQWQADHTPLPEDTVLFNKGVEEGKRLMMKDAVKGVFLYTTCPTIELDDLEDYNFKDFDDVRVIVLPKDD